MTNFTDLSLNFNILNAIGELNFEIPTPIQAKSIPHILTSTEDLIALAQTGTGKTAAFGLPILHKIDTSIKNIQAIILCPTRELCLQISKDLENFAKYSDTINIVSVYGGARIDKQIDQLRKGANIVVGTPGRTLDLIKRKVLKIQNIRFVVLDEADEMLNMGFREDMDAILADTPEEKQTLLYSATMPKEVRRIADTYMNNPVEISSGKKNTGAQSVEHHCYTVKSANRYPALKRIVDINPNIYGIIFCRTRRETKEVADHLMSDGYNADALHGDLSQAQRDHVMDRFRTGKLQLLVATDVAARGLDVNSLTHVLNYNLPDEPESYIHRSGRTGRAGKKGISVIISHGREGKKIRELEKLVGKPFERHLVPSGKEVCEKRLYNLIDRVEKTEVDEEKIASFLPEIMDKLQRLDHTELIKKFVSVEFNRFLEYYKGAKDLNIGHDDLSEKKKKKGKEKKEISSDEGYTRLYINIGEKDKITPARLLGFINEYTKSKDIDIRKIDILGKFSFFEVENEYTDLILSSFDNVFVGPIKVSIQVSKPVTKKEPKKKPKDTDRKSGFNKKRKKNTGAPKFANKNKGKSRRQTRSNQRKEREF